jgi:hypothetical protein
MSGRREEEEAADKIMVKARNYNPNQRDMTSARISSRAFLSLRMKEHGNGSGKLGGTINIRAFRNGQAITSRDCLHLCNQKAYPHPSPLFRY